MRMLIPLALAALIGLAPPVAQAQDAQTACPDGQVETPEGCSQQAWVDDCPPDHLCAAGSDEPQPYGPGDCIECSGPVDEPVSYGPDGCIDCTGAPVDAPTCMDGADDGEACDGDVQYFGPGPADTGSDLDDVPGEPDSKAESKDSPTLPALLLLAAVGIAARLTRRL